MSQIVRATLNGMELCQGAAPLRNNSRTSLQGPEDMSQFSETHTRGGNYTAAMVRRRTAQVSRKHLCCRCCVWVAAGCCFLARNGTEIRIVDATDAGSPCSGSGRRRAAGGGTQGSGPRLRSAIKLAIRSGGTPLFNSPAQTATAR